MEPSGLLLEVLKAHGIGKIPSDEEIDEMSEDEKRELWRKQRDAISCYRVRSQQEVDALKARCDEALRSARAAGIPIGDITKEMTHSMPAAIVLDDPAPQPSPLIETARPQKLQRPNQEAVNLATRSYNFTYVDRRLRVINREIAQLSKRVKALNGPRYRKKPCR